MARTKEDPRWGEAARARFGIAVKEAGHTQAECIAELVEASEIEPVTQETVSRWIHGRIVTPSCVDALLAYCDRHAPEADDVPAGQTTVEANDVPSTGPAVRLAVVPSGEPDPEPETSEPLQAESGWQHVREFAARLDELRADLRRERQRSRGLARDLARAAGEIEAALDSVDRIDAAAETYSRALKDRLG